MISCSNSLARMLPRLLAVLILCLMPAGLRAEYVIFRNDLRVPMVVQTATVVRGVMRRDQPILLRYGESTPKLMIDTNKYLFISHGKTNAVLFRGDLKVSKKPRWFAITLDQTMPGRVTLRAFKPPAMPRR